MHPVRLYRYRYKEPRNGKWYRTRYVLTEEEAAQRFPERERLDYTLEVRQVPDAGDAYAGLGYLQAIRRGSTAS
jgi:hypothetical protein